VKTGRPTIEAKLRGKPSSGRKHTCRKRLLVSELGQRDCAANQCRPDGYWHGLSRSRILHAAQLELAGELKTTGRRFFDVDRYQDVRRRVAEVFSPRIARIRTQ